MKLSAHFARSEFACACGCGFDTVDVDTLRLLSAVRAEFNVPVRVTSGARCRQYNADVGGVPDSQHLYGRAADIQVQGVEPRVVQDWIAEHFPEASLGRYQAFTHVDTRTNGPAHWG